MHRYLYTLWILGIAWTVQAQSNIAGKWQTGRYNTIVETYEKDGLWFGKIISSDNPDAKIGNDVLRDFKKKDGKWFGQLYAAQRDRLLDATIKPEGQVLKINISTSMFSRELEWKKVE